MFWQLSVREACQPRVALSTPITGGNSLSNEDGQTPSPHASIGMLGVLDDVARLCPWAAGEGDVVVLLGSTPTRSAVDYNTVHGTGQSLPAIDLG